MRLLYFEQRFSRHICHNFPIANREPANMYSFLCLLILALLSPLAQAFSRDGPPPATPVSPKLALLDGGKSALTGALVLMLTLPVAEPSWAATYATSEDAMSSLTKLDKKVDDLQVNLNSMIESIKDSVHNEVQSVKDEFLWAPGFTVATGIIAGIICATKSSDDAD
jgi:hypothetical protein